MCPEPLSDPWAYEIERPHAADQPFAHERLNMHTFDSVSWTRSCFLGSLRRLLGTPIWTKTK